MLDSFYSYAAAVITLATVYCWFRRSFKGNLPPGPSTLPIIGNMHQVNTDAHLFFCKMARKYGPLFSLQLGSLPFIVITDVEIAREALLNRGHLFAGRLGLWSGKLITRNQRDIVLGCYTELWKTHRKCSHHALYMFGDGMQRLEQKMLHEVERFTSYLSGTGSKAVDVSEEIDWTVFSFMCQVVFGHTYERDDPELKKLHKSLRIMTSQHYLSGFLDFFPFFDFLSYVYKSPRQKTIEAAVKARDEIFDEKFQRTKSSFKAGEASNYMEALLQAASELGDGERKLTDDHLIMSMFDIFVTGAETTSAAIKWAILYMTVWPEVQEKIHQEIFEVIGKDSDVPFVRLSNRKSLPYTEAALMETLRLATVAYVGVWHQTTEDLNLRGYDIPKGHNVVINYYAIHHNEKYFKDPFGFHPERFLDEDGQLVKGRNMSYLPFSAGPRSCLGEPLAKAELFIVVANLIHRFKLSTAPDVPHPDLKGIAGVHLVPKPYKVIFSSRG